MWLWEDEVSKFFNQDSRDFKKIENPENIKNFSSSSLDS